MSSDFDTGLKAYNQMKYEDAFLIFSHLAEQGDAGAQYQLGVMYADGKGVPQDDSEALRWYCKSAELGNLVAQMELKFCNLVSMS